VSSKKKLRHVVGRRCGKPDPAANFALAIMLENHRSEDPTAPRSGQVFMMLVNRLGGREVFAVKPTSRIAGVIA
jgi:hypothetical protein